MLWNARQGKTQTSEWNLEFIISINDIIIILSNLFYSLGIIDSAMTLFELYSLHCSFAQTNCVELQM